MHSTDQAVLTDFLHSVVWPSFNWATVADDDGQAVFTVRGEWDSDTDDVLCYLDGNRVTGSITGPSEVTLAESAPKSARVGLRMIPGGNGTYMPRAGGVPMLADLDMGNQRLRNLAPSEQPSDGVRRDEAASLATGAGDSAYIRQDGTAPPTQDQPWNGKKITGMADGVGLQDAATKKQVDAASSLALHRDGSNAATGSINLADNRIVNVGNPTDDADAINKRTLDARTLANIAAGTNDSQKVLLSNGSGGASWSDLNFPYGIANGNAASGQLMLANTSKWLFIGIGVDEDESGGNDTVRHGMCYYDGSAIAWQYGYNAPAPQSVSVSTTLFSITELNVNGTLVRWIHFNGQIMGWKIGS